MKIYLDYCDNGIWILGWHPDMPYPRINVCGCPVRLLQEYLAKGYEVVMSDAAKLICGNDLRDMSWNKQYFRWADKNPAEYQASLAKYQ